MLREENIKCLVARVNIFTRGLLLPLIINEKGYCMDLFEEDAPKCYTKLMVAVKKSLEEEQADLKFGQQQFTKAFPLFVPPK